MNKKQKQVIAVGIILIATIVIIWLLAGSDFFTKTQILVEKEVTELDQMLGVTPQKEYQDSFVFGLVPPGLVFSAEMLSVATLSGFILLISGLFYFKYKTKT
jgi:hypothetical protein